MSERESQRERWKAKQRLIVEAMEKLRGDDGLERERWLIYDYLLHNGVATSSEIFTALGLENAHVLRLRELRELGLIEQVGSAWCRVTGAELKAWDVTNRKILDTAPPPSELANLEATMREAIHALRLHGTIGCARIARRLELALKEKFDGD